MKKKSALLLAAVLSAAAVFAVVAGCGSSTTPATSINDGVKNLSNVKSAHVDFNVSLAVNGNGSAIGAQYKDLLPLNVTIGASADVNGKDPKNPQAQGTIKIGGINQILSTQTKSKNLNTQQMQALTTIESALGNLPFVFVGHDLFVSIGGNWYQTSSGSLLPSSGSSGHSTTVPGATSTSTGASTTSATTGTSTGTSTTAALQGCFTNAFKDTSKFGADKVLKNLKDTGTVTINGTSTHHYTGDIDFSSLLTQVASTARDCGNSSIAAGITAAKNQIGTVFKSGTVDFWIASGNSIQQAQLDLKLDPKAAASLLGMLGGSLNSDAKTLNALTLVELKMSVTLSHQNENFNITKPQGNIQNLSTYIKSLGLGSPFGSSASSSGSGAAAPAG